MSENWHLHEGDCIPHMATEMEPQSVDMVVCSVPFPSMFAYTSDTADLGNTDTMGPEATIHFQFFYAALARILKPGRVACIHVMQIPRMKRSGEVGLCDFRGINIRLGERAGLVYEYDWCIRRNPQAQALRTRSRELQFAGLESDRAKSRGALADYIIKFRAPGENAVPVCDTVKVEQGSLTKKKRIRDAQVSRNEWIQWAEAAWFDIRETHTLNAKEGKGEDDTKHICPLQLDTIERCIRLFTNPDELVMTPFAGIASEMYMALKLGRRAYGCEIKAEYIAAAKKNLAKLERQMLQPSTTLLFPDEECEADEESSVEVGAE